MVHSIWAASTRRIIGVLVACLVAASVATVQLATHPVHVYAQSTWRAWCFANKGVPYKIGDTPHCDPYF